MTPAVPGLPGQPPVSTGLDVPTGVDIPALAAELGGSGVPVQWEELTWQQAETTATAQNAVIIPVGATEQHGPHLPLAVDTLICRAVALGVSALTGVPVVPPLSFGVSASHGDFGGTVALRPETLIAVVEDVIDSLYASGVRQFILLNGHIWNNGALDVSAEKLRVRHRDARVRALGYVTMYPGPEVDGHVQYGRALMHANFFETSVMLHLHPELVRMDKATSHIDVDSFWDYRMDQVSETGVWGRDVADADAKHGEKEFDRCLLTTARAVSAAVREPWPDPTHRPGATA
ncbi:creatininase family protein [Streptomyces phaeochromogenes]|uniref:creatininase family protein n=1 Tax=Streptomyces phaeochromogenes TaxID=1923 RepID=UPI003866E01E|nr:creatininase family protein [Streptomyces phaeochromogenes]WTA08780.1 creatininase family protein [Streptomyces phaeochromogenes]